MRERNFGNKKEKDSSVKDSSMFEGCFKTLSIYLSNIHPVHIPSFQMHFSWLLGASLPAPILNCMSAVRRQFSSLDSLTISICQFTLD